MADDKERKEGGIGVRESVKEILVRGILGSVFLSVVFALLLRFVLEAEWKGSLLAGGIAFVACVCGVLYEVLRTEKRLDNIEKKKEESG